MEGRRPKQDIISRPALRIGRLRDFGMPALDQLVQQRRVFNRMDWWTPYDWLSYDGFSAAVLASSVVGALLVTPMDAHINDRLMLQGNAHVAWVRWCAIADGISASRVIQLLFQHSFDSLLHAGITSLYAIVESMSWMAPYLHEAQFTGVDQVVTMICRHPATACNQVGVPPDVMVRQAKQTDLPDVLAIDQSAFEELWQYPLPILVKALETSVYFSVAIQQELVVGYQFASADGQGAHITRLAVRSDMQRHGIGAALLADALKHLSSSWQVRYITLNTQVSNGASQKLYRQFRFELQQPSMQVLRRMLNS